MSLYTHKKLSRWRMVSMIFRGLASVLKVWPLLLLVACIVSPVTPHLRWSYRYQDYGPERIYFTCSYVGVKGTVNYMHGDTCPFIAFIDLRTP